MLKHSSEKLNFISKKSDMNVKAAENPKFSGFHFPYFPAETTFWSKFFYNSDVVRGFSEQWK
jgi:hypothetical protein